ncbi:glutathione S-transferase [Duganella sp. CF517]|uniref:glutathione S-transferase family protein n=1 Tax=Duganella sp. CF517 TaxID=1881038 RepID=UPI0008C2B6C5|nr:glutathione S-transferase [Duganella sp. CF517]SEN19457.1 glutathione S-transferase [Duganella sp. CF517]
MLKILGKATSINVRKVLWTCVELGIEFEREDWGAGFQSTTQESFVALNPNAMVPVLVDGDFVLWESNAICRYLCNKTGDTRLLPAEAQARARVEQWMDWQATELNNAWRYAFMALVRASPAHRDPVQIRTSVEAWNRHIGILDRQLDAGGPYVAGATFSLADVVLGLSVNRWMLAPVERLRYPAVLDYYERLGERPGFRRFGCNGQP